jgi:hypothetical protein
MQTEVGYDELVNELVNELGERFGSIAEFTRSETFKVLGFRECDSARMQTYLATPKSGKRKVKSARMMLQLAKEVLGREIVMVTEVRKTQRLFELVV